MTRNKPSFLSPFALAVVCCLSLSGQVMASTCVDCHTDEKLLLENLAQTKPTKSALQSGAG